MTPTTAARPNVDLGTILADATPRLQRFATRLCRSTADADDLVQETLRRACSYADGLDRSRDALPWLLRIAFRVFCDERKRRRRQPELHDTSTLVDTSDPRAATCRAELRDELAAALARMSPIERTLLLGFHREGHSLGELAHRHGMPINTVKSHLRRARHKLPGGAG